MTLRVEFIADAAGRVRPYLVDVERDEVLPGQLSCQIEADDGGDQFPAVTVTFAVDGRDVQFAPSVQKGPAK